MLPSFSPHVKKIPSRVSHKNTSVCKLSAGQWVRRIVVVQVQLSVSSMYISSSYTLSVR